MSNQTLNRNIIRPALLVIDVQKRFLPSIPQRDKEKSFFFINMIIKIFRDNGFPVIKIQHTDAVTGLVQGSDDFEFTDAIDIKPTDSRIIKTYSDSFNKTGLLGLLQQSGRNTVFLCGLSAVGCVMATYTGALNNDLKPLLVKDAIMSHNTTYTENVEIMWDSVNLNVVKMILEDAKAGMVN